MAPNMEMIVTYGPGKLVCSLKIPPSAAPSEELHRVLEEVAPPATLGKKWNGMEIMFGMGGYRNTYYEHAIVTEQLLAVDREHKNLGASVVFKEKACGWNPGKDTFDTPREDK